MIIKQSNSAQVTRELSSYMSFLLSKRESRTWKSNWNKDTWPETILQKVWKLDFSTLVAEQNAYTDAFLKVSTKEIEQFYKNTLENEVVNEVENMRKIALYSGKDSDFGVDSSVWFKKITEKINLLKKVEDKIAEELLVTIKWVR